MKFKAPNPTPPGLFRRTPPAVFPAIMGAFGLGLAWRRAAERFAVPEAIGEAVLGAISLLFLFSFVAYAAKFLRRPGVIVEDLRILPGRAGLAALMLCLYLQALALAPHGRAAAEAVLFAGLGLHVAFVAVLVWQMVRGPAEQRRVTPVWHLSFVGFIVGALAASALGHAGLAFVLFAATATIAALVWAISADQLLNAEVPAPLRPLLAIHLSPAALLGLVAAAFGLSTLATIFAALAAVLLGALLLRGRWLTAAGFSPLWGAFTFPLAATASLWLTLGGPWRLPGGLALVLATLVIPPILFRVLKMWAGGQLAVKTNAAAA
ncbi:TDT family transporter [Albidovulum sp.]